MYAHICCVNTNIFPDEELLISFPIINRTSHLICSVPFCQLPHLSRYCWHNTHISNILTQRIVFTLTIELIYRIELTASDSSQASFTSYFSMELKYLKKTKNGFFTNCNNIVIHFDMTAVLRGSRRHKFNFITASTIDFVVFFFFNSENILSMFKYSKY